MKKIIAGLVIVSGLSACGTQEHISDYRPIVDPDRVNAKKFERDLSKCQLIAIQVEADYRERQQAEAWSNLAAGLIVGAAAGAIVGNGTDYKNDMVKYGALSGAAAGLASGDYTADFVKFGPRRVVDRCMLDKGHNLLNDLGRG